MTTTAEVSAADDRNPGNDTAGDTTSVTGPDLTVDSDHTGAFRVGGTGTYTIGVDNGGVDPTRGTTTVTDTLPAGLTFNSASGSGWDCSEAAQVVTCTHAAEIAAGHVRTRHHPRRRRWPPRPPRARRTRSPSRRSAIATRATTPTPT